MWPMLQIHFGISQIYMDNTIQNVVPSPTPGRKNKLTLISLCKEFYVKRIFARSSM